MFFLGFPISLERLQMAVRPAWVCRRQSQKWLCSLWHFSANLRIRMSYSPRVRKAFAPKLEFPWRKLLRLLTSSFSIPRCCGNVAIRLVQLFQPHLSWLTCHSCMTLSRLPLVGRTGHGLCRPCLTGICYNVLSICQEFPGCKPRTPHALPHPHHKVPSWVLWWEICEFRFCLPR